MKRRTEDKLINLAYGELSPEEASALEAQAKADPEAARMLSSYRQMKLDMPRLNAIPEMQLSGDRLRDAILHSGLKKRSRLAAWGWVLAPGLAAALAIVLFLNRPTAYTTTASVSRDTSTVLPTSHSDLVAINTPPKVNVFHADTEETNPAHAERMSFSFGGDESTPAIEPTHRSMGERIASRHSNRSRIATPSKDAETSPDSDGTFALDVPAPANNIAAAPEDANVSAQTKADQKVVVVDESKDTNTGAAKATEVGSSTDVLVGG